MKPRTPSVKSRVRPMVRPKTMRTPAASRMRTKKGGPTYNIRKSA